MSSEQRGSNLATAALYIGVPVLVGASCYYLYYANKASSSNSSSSNSAKLDIKKLKQLSPKEHLAQLKQTGNQNFSKFNYVAAIDHYTKAIEFGQTLNQSEGLKPDDFAIFYQNRAACNFELGHYDKVISDCDKAIELKKNYVKAYVKRAKAYEKLEKFDKAMVDAYSANLLDKFQSQSNMSLADSIVKASSKNKASEAMKNHKPTWSSSQTIKNYFAAFVCDPIKDALEGACPNEENLGQLLDEANKPENVDDPLSILVRGTCASLMGDMKLAEKELDRLIEMDDEKVTLRLKSNALIKRAALVIGDPSADSANIEKDLETTHELLDKAIKLDPENPDLYLHKSQAFVLTEKLDEAIVNLDKAIELKEDFYSAIAQKFYIEFKIMTRDPTGGIEKAKSLLDNFKNAVKKYPDSIPILEMYAQVLTEIMHFEEADQALQELAKLDPENGSVYVSRALLQFHIKNDPDEVSNLLQQALKIDPKIIFAYEILGSIENQRGKVDEAIKIFETALKYAQSEAEFARCYSLLDSSISQRAAAEHLGMQV